MPTATDTQLVTHDNWTLRVRAASQAPERILLMLHGWTGDENSMWIFTRDSPAHYHVLAPRAPYPADKGGYSWRELKPGTWGWPTVSELRPAAEALRHLVDEIAAKSGLDATTFDVMGFSQGGAMTALLAMLFPYQVRKAAVLSGFVPAGADELVAAQPLTGKTLFVAHGAHDKLVPLERAQQSMAALEQAGAQINFCAAEVGHKVSADCLRGLQSYFTD